MDSEEEANDVGQRKDDGQKKSVPYPWHVFFIFVNEFCQSFSYFGMRAILTIFFKSKLGWSTNLARTVYHGFIALCYFTPAFGSIVADEFLGKYRTIIYLSLVYILGHVLNVIAPIPEIAAGLVALSMSGLVLVAVGSGGIKACVSAFGGDQFELPEHSHQLVTFFSVFYFSSNAGSLISMVATPILRKRVHCFGEHTCYSLAFAIPALMMTIATIVIMCGQRMYVINKPEGNVLLPVVTSIAYAMKKKLTSKTKVAHWMDHALDKYSRHLVDDVKSLLAIVYMFLPLPLFSTLNQQQGSTWTVQATSLNGELGPGVVILPDQMQMLNAALILVFLGVFNYGLYPLCRRFRVLKRPLQRMATGGFLTALAFVVGGCLELEVLKTHGREPSANRSQINVMNGFGCPVMLSVNSDSYRNSEIAVGSGSNHVVYDLVPGKYLIEIAAAPSVSCKHFDSTSFEIDVLESEVHAVVFTPKTKLADLEGKEKPRRHVEGDDNFSFYVLRNDSSTSNFPIEMDDGFDSRFASATYLKDGVYYADYVNLAPGTTYKLKLGEEILGEVRARPGGVHSVVVFGDNNNAYSVFTLTNVSSVHMLWQVPQYAALAMGEVLFSVTRLEFSYSQAPESMKAVVQAIWMLAITFGSLLVLIINAITEFKDSDTYKLFFVFAGLMAVDMIIFCIMAHFYTYRTYNGEKDDSEQEGTATTGKDSQASAEASKQ